LTPLSTIAEASPTAWQHTPTAPSLSWCRAISEHLWLLACGLSLTALFSAKCAMRARLRSKGSASMMAMGVSRLFMLTLRD
jgi:hypothetical protein